MESVKILKIKPSKKVYGNEWHLLCFVLRHIAEMPKLPFKIITVPKHLRLLNHLSGLRYKRNYFIINKDEIDAVFDILREEYEIVVRIEPKKELLCMYTKENAPKEKLELPF